MRAAGESLPSAVLIRVVHLGAALHAQTLPAADELLLDGLRRDGEWLAAVGARGRANEWLLESPWKRSVAALLYGDLLAKPTADKRILDVGGGLSHVTLDLAARGSYTLIETADHESEGDYRRAEDLVGRPFAVLGDWVDAPLDGTFDVAIAADVFPNVDQRLYEFVDRLLPLTGELRLSLTYYEETIFTVTRVPSGERLTVKPWGLREVRDFVRGLAAAVGSSVDEGELRYEPLSSLFGNRRNVLLLWVRSPR